MDVVFGWLFVSTFLSKVIQIESSLELSVGNFRVLRRHPQLRQCAVKALRKHVYVGARISDKTGVCKGLPHSWGRNQTIESGYGYAKNVHVRINYEPPLEVHYDGTFLTIPGVVHAEAKLDLHITWAKFDNDALFMYLKDAIGAILDISCYPTICTVVEEDEHGNTYREPDNRFDLPQQFSTTNQWKISFVAQSNTLNILVDDEVVTTKKLTTVRLNSIRQIGLQTNGGKESSTPKLRIQSLEFTEA